MGLKSLSRETLPGPKTRWANIEGPFVIPSSASLDAEAEAMLHFEEKKKVMTPRVMTNRNNLIHAKTLRLSSNYHCSYITLPMYKTC
jgi:hypothetical protein